MRIIPWLLMIGVSLLNVVGNRNAIGQVADALAELPELLANRLQLADAEYWQALEDAAADAEAAISKRIDDAAKKGDLDRVRLCQAALRSLETDLSIPPEPELKTVIVAFDRSVQKARAAWDRTYEQVEREYTKTKRFDVAESVRTRSQKGPRRIVAGKAPTDKEPTEQQVRQMVPAPPAKAPAKPAALRGLEFVGFKPWTQELGFHPQAPDETQIICECEGKTGRISGKATTRERGSTAGIGGHNIGWIGKAALWKLSPLDLPQSISTEIVLEKTEKGEPKTLYEIHVFPPTPSSLDNFLPGAKTTKGSQDYPALVVRLSQAAEPRCRIEFISSPTPDGRVRIGLKCDGKPLDGQLVVSPQQPMYMAVGAAIRMPSDPCDLKFQIE